MPTTSMEYIPVPQSSSSSPVLEVLPRPSIGEAGIQPENDSTPQDVTHELKNRTPIILHPVAGWSLVSLCGAMGAVVIVLYCVSQTRNGFPIHAGHTFRDDVVRFLWSSGPALPMTVVTGLVLAPLAFNVWLHAPYTELERGPAPGEISLFMNWTTKGPFERIYLACKHRRLGLVTLGIATLLSGFLPIVASGLLGPQTIIADYPVSVRITAHLGIGPSSEGVSDGRGNHIFGASTQYLQAVAAATAQPGFYPLPVAFSLSSQEANLSVTPLSFSRNDIARHEFDSSIVANLTAEVYAIETNANCSAAHVTFGGKDVVVATLGECSYSFHLSTNQTFSRWHFSDSTPCSNASRYDVAFKTFVYAVYRPSNATDFQPSRFLVMFCSPTISILKVSAKISFTTQNGLGALVEPPRIISSFPIGSNTTDEHAVTLLRPPLNGNAVNGYDLVQQPGTWNYSRTARANITKLLLFEGIYTALLHLMDTDSDTDPDGGWFSPENREQQGRIIAGYYQTYVSTFSRSLYFNPNANTTTIDATLSALSSRLFVARLNAGGLSGLLFFLAILITITLIKQPRPKAGGIAVILAEDASPGGFMQVAFKMPLRKYDRFSASDIDRGVVVHAE